MSRPLHPPRLAREFLQRVLPADCVGAIDELDEKFSAYAASAMGPRAARRWYWRQAAGVLHPHYWRATGVITAPEPRTKGNRDMASNLLRDLKFGIRMLAKNPTSTAVIVLTLAIGLGFNGAIFSLANTIVLNDIPIEEPDRVLYLDSHNRSEGRDSMQLSYLDYRDIAESVSVFGSLGAIYRINANLSDGVEVPIRYVGLSVEPSVFDVLRITPVLGRRLMPADSEPDAERVAMIGYAVWRARYGGSDDVIGRVVQVNDRPTTVVGVLPPELEVTPFVPHVWLAMQPTEPMRTERDNRFLLGIGRLGEGKMQADAQAEIEAIAGRLADAYPETNEGVGGAALTYGETFTDPGNRAIIFILLGAVGFLLLIACANVANLLVARAINRSREVVIRTAMGASRWRLVRQLLVESLLLSVLAGVTGCLFAVGGAGALARAVQVDSPPAHWDLSVRPSVFVLIFVLAGATSVIFGLMPALHATRRDVSEALKDGGRASGGGGTRRLTGALVVAQVALSLILLAGAGVMVRSTLKITELEWSIDPRNVMTARFLLPTPNYPEPENILAFHDELHTRLSQRPGIETMAVASSLPTQGGAEVSAELEGTVVDDGDAAAFFSRIVVSPEYFELADAGAVRGRLFDRTDDLDTPPVVVVEQRAADRYWPGEDPVGKRFRWTDAAEEGWVEVVGVAPTLRQSLGLEQFEDLHPIVYVPFGQQPSRAVNLIVRSPTPPDVLAAELREQVAAVYANLPLYGVATLNEVIDGRTFGWRIVSVLFGLLGGVALLLASIGIYAVMAFAAGNRRQEIGIRMALGARENGIIALVARSSVVQVALGLAIGLIGAYFLNRLLGMFMFDVSPTDPLTFALVLVLLTATSAIASIVPARRASRVDPVVALRPD